MTPKAARLAFRLASYFEGLRLKPYLCPASYWTIGRGARFYENGTPVKPTDPAITEERADALLMHGIVSTYLPAAVRAVSTADTFGRAAATGRALPGKPCAGTEPARGCCWA